MFSGAMELSARAAKAALPRCAVVKASPAFLSKGCIRLDPADSATWMYTSAMDARASKPSRRPDAKLNDQSDISSGAHHLSRQGLNSHSQRN